MKTHLLSFRIRILAMLMLMAGGLWSYQGNAQTVSTPFTSSGTFAVPAGVTNVKVELWGGGGGGGGVVSGGAASLRAGGGGSGGTYTLASSVAVTPGANITVTVGAGGTAATASNGGTGGTSTFASASPVTAAGGGGGIAGTSTTVNGGGGGTSTGTTNNGGTGAGAVTGVGGGGGGGAGNAVGVTGNGANATTSGTGAAGAGGAGTVPGGAGGAGASASGNGSPATVLSGGGGGARDNANNTSRSGGVGFKGEVIVTYTRVPTKLVITSILPTSPTVGTSFSVTVQAQDATGAVNVTSGTLVNLSLTTGTGTLGGTLSGTITTGNSSVTITGVTYSVAESITIAAASAGLTSGSSTFTVILPATQLVITSINPATPFVNTAFTVNVQSQNANGVVTTVTTATTFTLSVVTGTGTLAGTITGTIASGASTATVAPTPTYNVAETGVSIQAASTSGMSLTGVASGTFTVSGIATHLVTTISPASPSAGTNFTVTVTATDASGNPANVTSNTAITLTKATGSGTLSGTLTGLSITSGTSSVVYNAVKYNVAESGVSITATRTGGMSLTAGTSAPFTVVVGPVASFTVLASGGGVIGTQASGTPFNIQITALDAGGNTVTSFAGPVNITSTVGTISPTSSSAFVNGVISSLPVTITGGGSAKINVTDPSSGSTGASATFTVTVNYYSKSTGNLQTQATWGTNTDGTGVAPVNFTSAGQVFFIQNNAAPTITAAWTVSGAGSKVVVGDGTNATNFTIPSGFAFSGTADVSNNGTLTLLNSTIPTFGTLANNSTINYARNATLTITTATYGNLTLSGGGTKQVGVSTSPLTLTINGNLTIGSGTIFQYENDGIITSVVKGSMFLNGGTFNVLHVLGSTNHTLAIGGDLIGTGTNSFTTSNSTDTVNVTFNGATQQISGLTTATFSSLTISSTVSTTLGNNITVNSNLSVGSGIFDLSTFTANRGAAGGKFILAGTLRLAGPSGGQTGSNFPKNYTTTTISGSTVEYYGTTQSIYNSVTYNNLVISTAGVKTLLGATSSITGNLTINAGATLDLVALTLNKSGGAGTFTMGAGSLLRLKATTGGITGSNFPSNLVPTLDPASTVEYYGTSHQTVANVVSGYGNLTVNNAAGVDLPNDQTVAGALNLVAGKLDATAATLTLSAATPSITGASASSYIITDDGTNFGTLTVSHVPAGSFQFPIGTSSLYMPATVVPSTSTSWSANVFTPATTDGAYHTTAFTGTALNAIVNSIWTITPASGTTADLKLNWDASLEGSQFQLYADNQIGISHYNAGAGAFDPAIQTSASHTGHTVTANFSAFSPFGIGFINDPLPVILVDFNAVLNSDKTVGLSWSTQQEVNSSHFDVLRSTDGSTWVSIGTVEAKGNASFVSNYAFTDKSPASGINYYRLKMVDIDGKFGYSNIRVIRTTSFSGISVFPNPARDYVNVSIGGSSSPKTIRLISQNGQVMQIKSVNSTTGTTISMNVHNYVQGTYYLQIIGTDGTNQTTKVVIAR